MTSRSLFDSPEEATARHRRESDAKRVNALLRLPTIAEQYRGAVRAGLCDGKGIDGAHAAAQPILQRALDLLRRAGFTDGEAVNALAAHFHG